MSPVKKALWFIESHLAEDLTLDTVAKAGGVSRYHISRAFGLATGHSVMGYVRGRRLTEAARLLAKGAPDILAVALDAGYGSHEAFTRAFRDQFGLSPEMLRTQGHLNTIQPMEALKMDEAFLDTLEPPRMEHGRAMTIVGLSERCTDETSAAIPMQWQRFSAYIGHIPRQIGKATYGVLRKSGVDGEPDYICGVEVADFTDAPPELSGISIPAKQYAVFTQNGHVSTIRRTWHTIWNKWVPASGVALAETPCFERYGEGFNSETGAGGFEIWLPVKR